MMVLFKDIARNSNISSDIIVCQDIHRMPISFFFYVFYQLLNE
ncbi:hypothetical protein BAAA27672_07120 [Bifidobacterium animalis subsp. animalis ATCC 27672]|nr:hypothetical protein BAAA27672_07120 [Bifidobacterium animalis subsp. animalis ATCC 27672]